MLVVGDEGLDRVDVVLRQAEVARSDGVEALGETDDDHVELLARARRKLLPLSISTLVALS